MSNTPKCLECPRAATYWCENCKAWFCDVDLQHCDYFNHTLHDLGEKEASGS